MDCFKTYDIRGRLGSELNAEIMARIGRGFARVMGARQVVLGHDARETSPDLADALAAALMAEGCTVLDLGLCGTEEVYFATAHFDACGGLCVTASHNPIEYNGLKLVGRGAAPLDPEGELAAIRAQVERDEFGPGRGDGARRPVAAEARAAYVERVLSFIRVEALRPLRIVVNAGNGAAGPTFDAIAAELARRGAPLEFRRMHHAPDPTFPNGIPNPLLEANRAPTIEATRAAQADFAVAWDGDFDRCFFFDHTGGFVEGEYAVALLAEAFLAQDPGAAIAHDGRITWAVQATIATHGGRPVQTRTGHAYFKAALRATDAVYGGEMSAHHYFRDFACCDSGMIPWLLIAELVSRRGRSLADLVAELRAAHPSSGEINFRLPDPAAAVSRVRQAFEPAALAVDTTDGLGLDFADWRFNLRASNTEPVLRLNVETRGDPALLARQVGALRALIMPGA
ncbi:phosphomannomutase [Pararhodobacter sp. SW119]|uniref:phosphomannomutase n=1 Tax=Pararhodobacter sp. SW119 TaxID=2780075 RepID=UPI001AE07D5B|nr:phosphomannomutase [Pararhodobacter sp. SW119]